MEFYVKTVHLAVDLENIVCIKDSMEVATTTEDRMDVSIHEDKGRTLDFGHRLTPNAIKSLLNYFISGDPNITSMVDAVAILEMGEELRLCESDGTPYPGHESLINQLIFTIQTAQISEDEVFEGYLVSEDIPELREKCLGAFQSSIQTKHTSDAIESFAKSYPTEYNQFVKDVIMKRAEI